MENNPKPPFNAFSAFPAQDRTKMEVIDAWLNANGKWSESMKDPNNNTKLADSFFAISKWYILVHGYTKARKNEEISKLKDKLQFIPMVAIGKKLITDVITINELTNLQLLASEYMYAIGITDILMHHRPDELYIAIGQAER